MVFNEVLNSRILQKLKGTVGESVRLVWVDRNVRGIWIPVRYEPLADVESRDAVSQSNLDRLSGALAHYPSSQRFTFSGADGNREEAVRGAVRSGDGNTVSREALDHASDLPER